MKSTLKLFAMLMLVTFMASCSEESDELGTTQSTDKEVYMTFSGSTDATLRTVINSTDNSKIDFAAGDAISVFGENKVNKEFTTKGGGNVALFEGQATPSDGGYTLLYPYQGEATVDAEGKITGAVIPAEQVATVGTFDPKANLSIATAADRTNAFKLLNVCSLIRFNVTADYDFVTLTDVEGRAVAGEVKINPADGTATAVDEKASKSVTLTNLKKDNVYYIALLPGAIKLNLKFMTTDGKSFVKTKSTSIDLGRSKVLNIGKITAEESEMTQEWVDLNLPSGTLWATCNLGATSPIQPGDLYAWGETTTKTSYTVGNYTYKDNPTTLPLKADAAHVVLGGKWRMPTKGELKELQDNCYALNVEHYDTKNYGWGYNGLIYYKVVDASDKGKYNNNSITQKYNISMPHIFLIQKGVTYLRSSTRTDDNNACATTIITGGFNIQDALGRMNGMNIRPVYDKNL